MKDFLGDLAHKIWNQIEESAPKFYIFVLSENTKHFKHSYMLSQHMSDGKINTLLAKGIMDKSEFDKEVNNLAKYFNAEIIGTL